MSSTAPPPKVRLRGIDSARGAAMLFVCLAHFGSVYSASSPERAEWTVVWLVSMIASPTFMLLSGMMAGMLSVTRADAFPRIRRTLADRGLFLLTVGHALIVVSYLPSYPSLSQALWRGFITDVIAVSIIVGPWIVGRVSTLSRLGLAGALFASGWLMLLGWTPEGGLADTFRYLLAGPDGRIMRWNFPVLPWLATYLVGTALGERLGARLDDGARVRAEWDLLRIGAAAAACAVLMKGGYLMVSRATGWVPTADSAAYMLTSPLQKYPPSLAYLLWYGGLGLILTGLLLRVDRVGFFDRPMEWLSLLGRTSLFVFLLQFYLYFVVFHYLALPFSHLWPLYYVLSICVVYGVARWWQTIGGNRYLEVSYWLRGVRLRKSSPRTLESAVPPPPTA
jgi:uncharacterized membrane protein